MSLDLDAIETAWNKAVKEDATLGDEIAGVFADNASALIAAARKTQALEKEIECLVHDINQSMFKHQIGYTFEPTSA